MKYLIIDAGNTRVKVVVFEEDSLLEEQICTGDSLQETFSDFFLRHHFSRAILSSVGGLTSEIQAYVTKRFTFIIAVEYNESSF